MIPYSQCETLNSESAFFLNPQSSILNRSSLLDFGLIPFPCQPLHVGKGPDPIRFRGFPVFSNPAHGEPAAEKNQEKGYKPQDDNPDHGSNVTSSDKLYPGA